MLHEVSLHSDKLGKWQMPSEKPTGKEHPYIVYTVKTEAELVSVGGS